MSIQAGQRRSILLTVFLLTCLIPAASAGCHETRLVVLSSNVAIDNPGATTPGSAVVMSVRVDFPDKENTTYPETSQLELTSGLDEPTWSWYIERNGVKKPITEERKSRVIISGDILAWPANTTEYLDVELYGTAPAVMENKNLTVMRIQDIAGTSCNGDSVFQYNAWVLNTTITNERISRLYTDLARLRADAAAKNRTGTAAPAIKEKIDEAQRSLDEANATPVFEFVSVAMALNRTDAAIADGRRLLAEVPATSPPPSQPAVPAATTRQTPVSSEPAPVLNGILGCLGAAGFLVRKRQ